MQLIQVTGEYLAQQRSVGSIGADDAVQQEPVDERVEPLGLHCDSIIAKLSPGHEVGDDASADLMELVVGLVAKRAQGRVDQRPGGERQPHL